MSRLIEVALHLPLFRSFTYRARADLALAPGHRVVVPFRNRRTIGVVVSLDAVAEPGRSYKDVLAVPDAEPALSQPLLATCRWIAEHYVAPLGVVARTALPPALASAERPVPAERRHRVVRLVRRLDSLLERERIFRRAPKQRAVYDYLESLAGPVPAEHVAKQLGISASTLGALERRGLLSVTHEAVSRDPFAAREPESGPGHEPTEPQRLAIETIGALRPGGVALLHGVTGSGKTLVYLEVLQRMLRARGAGATAIVLVPEIALTPQTVDRFRRVFGDGVAVLHSALSDGERLDAWLALRRGEKRIVVGARSAVFAPVQNVAVIVVDEEHEASYKQDESPRYHARDAAVIRAKHEGAAVVLGSATPSLESWALAKGGKYALVELRERVGGGRLPAVEVVDMRREKPGEAGGGAGAPPPRFSR